MSTRRERQRLLGIAVIGVATCCALAGVAYGFVEVYSNSFASKPQFRSVKTVSGEKCDRVWKEKHKRMGISTKNGPRHCRYKLPVQGSSPQPDHRFDLTGRISKETEGAIRSDAYISSSVRVGDGKRYEVRVFPKDRDYELRRKPGGGGFPNAGGSGAIKGIGKANKIRLLVEGARVRVTINGTEVADLTDASPGELKGTKIEFGVGSERNTSKATRATIDSVKVSVPTP